MITLNEFRKRGFGMTAYEFFEVCNKYNIEPDIAMENDNIKNAVDLGEYHKIETLLKEEF